MNSVTPSALNTSIATLLVVVLVTLIDAGKFPDCPTYSYTISFVFVPMIADTVNTNPSSVQTLYAPFPKSSVSSSTTICSV